MKLLKIIKIQLNYKERLLKTTSFNKITCQHILLVIRKTFLEERLRFQKGS